MRLIVAAVGRLKQGPERELLARYRERAPSRPRHRACASRDRRDRAKAAPQMPSGACTEESIALANSFPTAPPWSLLDEQGENLRLRRARRAMLQRWRDQGRPAVVFIIGGPDGVSPRAARQGRALRSPSAPRPGRISWCGSCCWNRSTGRSQFCPATPITAAG